jgi:hypothetical protein
MLLYILVIGAIELLSGFREKTLTGRGVLSQTKNLRRKWLKRLRKLSVRGNRRVLWIESGLFPIVLRGKINVLLVELRQCGFHQF